ncbi:MAG: PAS domain S-box protein [Methylococcaceae bacterium]|nr:MAG: PAS domain S-box protein [Methylococcaceae bacterium]
MRESNERFRQLFEQAPIGMIIIGCDRKLRKVNDAFCRILGYSPEELINKTVLDLTHPDDAPKSDALSKHLFAGDIPEFVLEKRCIRKFGEPVWIQLTATLIRDEKSGVLCGLGIIQDINDRKLAAEQRIHAMERECAPLVKEIHHRFKNSLHGIVGLLDVYRHGMPAASPVICDIIGKIKSFVVVFGLQGKALNGEIVLDEMIEEIALSVEELMLTPIHKELTLDASFLVLQNRAVPIALILNELLCNAVKHGEHGTVYPATVRLRPGPDAESVEALIENPLRAGVTALDFERGQGLGLGLELVKSLLPRGAELTIREESGGMQARLILDPALIHRQP